MRDVVALIETVGRLPPEEAAFFARQLSIYFTSSDERRFGQWEHMSWWDFVQADRMSDEYRAIANFIPRAVALRPRLSSSRSVGNYWELVVNDLAGLGNHGPQDGVMNAPTNEAFITPWADYLGSLGVNFWFQSVEALELSRGRIVSALVRSADGTFSTVEADWFVCAMPMEYARQLWTPAILNADPRLEAMNRLQTAWVNGVQFYLRRPVSVVRGHIICVDSPWSVVFLTQAQFWNRDFPGTYGDGSVADCLSAYVAEFDQPGIVFGKTARECTPAEFVREVWMQIKAHVEDTGKSYFPNDILQSWFIDPGLFLPGVGPLATNQDAHFLNSVSSWDDRPGATTAIPNLFLGADYVKTDFDVATMEAANEAGRAAANAVLAASGSRSTSVQVFPRYRPPEFAAARLLDAQLYRSGLPNALDVGAPVVGALASLPLVHQTVGPLLGGILP